MSMTFTKLFSSITESTIWAEPDAVRIVWITMLAMADRHGRIWASVPGLANRARVSLEACEDALDRFQKPDKYSRTPDHEGRRIEAIDGGWRLLNHAKYRSIRDEESALEAKRKYAAKKRAARKVEKVDPSRSESNKVDASRDNAEADADADSETNTPKAPKGADVAAEGFADFWNAYPRKTAKPNAIKAWNRLKPSPELQSRIIEAVQAASQTEGWTKDNGQFIPHPATYLNGRRWEDLIELPQTKESLHARLTAHIGNPNHVAHSKATPDQLTEFAEILKRYRAMT